MGMEVGWVTGTCEAGLHVLGATGLWGRPTGGVNHHKTNSIGGKGRPCHQDLLKGFEEGKPVVPRRKHYEIMWDL